MSALGCITLFYNRIIAIGLIYGVLLCWQLKLVYWWLHRLCLLWVSRWVMHNGVTLYRCNYSEIADIFFLGRNRL